MCIPLKPVFSRHEGDGVQITDEPTGNLDSAAGAEIMDLLRAINQNSGQTILMVTHSQEAAKSSNRVITVKDRMIV
ncbi:MAG: hypothetical protein HFH15_15260 [Ruminococcus sp.]|jgi:putative ABC transport system ATP-binding protein|nr:hypothetical protein [Ruminococcus sp.]